MSKQTNNAYLKSLSPREAAATLRATARLRLNQPEKIGEARVMMGFHTNAEALAYLQGVEIGKGEV